MTYTKVATGPHRSNTNVDRGNCRDDNREEYTRVRGQHAGKGERESVGENVSDHGYSGHCHEQ